MLGKLNMFKVKNLDMDATIKKTHKHELISSLVTVGQVKFIIGCEI